MWQSCVWKICVWKSCVWQSCVWKVRVTKLCVTCICEQSCVKISVRHQSQSSAISATPATRSGGRYREVPGLPRKVTVDVAKCHACHANSGGAHGAKREPSAPPEPASAISATRAMQSGGRCRQVWRVPRKVPADVAKCHSCHQARGGAHGAKREPSAPPVPAQCQSYACHAKWRSMSPSATPAAQSGGRCRQVPRLPRKQRRRPRRQTGTKRATRASPVP